MTLPKTEEKYSILSNLTEDEIKEKYGDNMSFFLGNLLHARSVNTEDEIRLFTNPGWEDNHDPFLLKDMDKAVSRILEAIYNNEKILIYSDYDTDGIPGGAIFRDFLNKINYDNFSNYIPNRNKDGYGLNLKACETFVEEKVDLMVTIDCGITDIKEADFLKKNSIDLIVTDHHLPEKQLPDAFAVIDHKREDCGYPDKNICGCAIAFKLIQALITRGREEQLEEFVNLKDGWEKWLLDLVSVSTICDMVPLVGENRVFVKYGKKVLAKTQRPGLNRIFEKSRLNKSNITADDIGFMIGPRINAASRLSDPNIALQALSLSEDSIEFANELERLNNRRKTMTATIMKEVWGTLKERKIGETIVIGNDKWPLGILGLIAGRVADKYKKPTFVWTKLEDSVKGSCRSGADISVHSLMEKTKKSFDSFGGHKASGGFVTSLDKIHFLEQELNKNISKAERVENKDDFIDMELKIKDVSMQNYYHINSLEPYGMSNPKPLFLFKNINIERVETFGKTEDHLRLSFIDESNSRIKGISFSYKEKLGQEFNEGQVVDLIGSFDVNNWNGNSYLRLKIEDIILS